VLRFKAFVKKTILLPVYDYYKYMDKIWVGMLISGLIALVLTLIVILSRDKIYLPKLFQSFIDIQINSIAILLSFSIAVITVLVTSDSNNIIQLRKEHVDTNKSKRNNIKITLFNLLMINITYNIVVEVFYFLFLIIQIFLQYLVCDNLIIILLATNIFFLSHILIVLLESVREIYLVFWPNK